MLDDYLIFYIFSFLDFNEIVNLNLNINLIKGIISTKLNKYNLNEYWINGIFNNLNNLCFNCSNKLNCKYVTIICINCEVELDNYFKFPEICLNCSKINNLKNTMISKCCIYCENNRIHLITNKPN